MRCPDCSYLFLLVSLPLSIAAIYLHTHFPITTANLAERLRQLASHISTILPANVKTTLPGMANNAADAEEQRFQDEVKELKQWWGDSRWRFTRRPYTAEQIANKRGNLKIEFASNAMAKKLWALVEQKFAVGGLSVKSLASVEVQG